MEVGGLNALGKETTGLNCMFCGTVCKNYLKHLEKYHKGAIAPFPKTEIAAGKFFRWRT